MKKAAVLSILVAVMLLALGVIAEAQQPRVYRVGVLLPASVWYEIIDGLRVGVRQLGLEEGKQFVLEIQDTKGDAKAAEAAARKFEQEKVNLIYTAGTSVTIAAKRATADIPIVFCAGTDPGCSRACGELRKTGGKTHRRPLQGHRPHGEAPGDPEGDCPEAPPGTDI